MNIKRDESPALQNPTYMLLDVRVPRRRRWLSGARVSLARQSAL